MSNAALMVDLSSNNALPDLKAHYNAGHRVIALKVSEGEAYHWDQHGRLADEWHRLGGQVWHYHFARPGNAKQQAHYFLSLITAHWQKGDRVVLDAEVAGVGAAFVRDFIDYVATRYGDWPGVVYSYASFLTSVKIRPSHDWGLWLAAYQPVQPQPVNGWTSLAAWQFTDKQTGLAGIKGAVDCSHLLDVAQPKPSLTPEERRRLRARLLALRHRVHRIRRKLRRKP